MADQILAGFGKVDITPALDDPPTFEIYDPLYFRALHLRQGSEQVTFLAADLFILDDRFTELVARELTGDVDPNWVLAGASHLGTGPTLFQYYVNQPTESLKEFGQDEKYARAAARAIKAAAADASAAEIATGIAEAEERLQYNRRAHDAEGNLVMVSLTQYPQPPAELKYDAVDRQFGLLRIDRPGKRPLALTNFGCHALARWDQRGNISGDYPGRLAAHLEAEGIDSLFFQGALGNVHPVREGEDPAERIGRSLARTALALFRSLDPSGEVELRLGSRSIELIPAATADVDSAREEWELQPAAAEGLARYHYWRAQHYREDRTTPFAFHSVAIGSTALLHMPGEPFVETAQAIRAEAPYESVMILCNPCPEVGYLPTPEAHREGGDEPMFAALEAESEAEIRREAIGFLKKTCAR